MRTRLLPLACLAGLAGAALAAMPGLATGGTPPSTGSFTAADSLTWNAEGGGSTVTIAPGGVVSFAYPAGGSNRHNADFGTGPQPTACTQTGGASSGAVPPLPSSPTAPGWTGNCTFATAGTYSFFCDLHRTMRGTVVVTADTGTPTEPRTPPTTPTTPTTPGRTTPTTPTTPGRTTPTTPNPGPGRTTPTMPGTGGGGGGGGGSTPQGPAGPLNPPAGPDGGPTGGPGSAALRTVSLRIVRRQIGTSVRGTARLGRARARLRVELLASRRALGLRGAGQALAGSFSKRAAGPGDVAFTAKLGAAARRALQRHGRLALVVRVTATPVGGGKARRTSASVTLSRGTVRA